MSTKKELLVYGFVRECWKSMKYVKNLPIDIINLFCLWLSLMDSWDKINSDEGMTVSVVHNDDGSVHKWIERTIAWNGTATNGFGINIVSKPQIKSWKFEIPKENKRTAPTTIGIFEAKFVEQNIGDFSDKSAENEGYGVYTLNWQMYKKGIPIGVTEYFQEYSEKYEHDDTNKLILTMELDLSGKNGILKYKFDDYHHLMINENNIACDDVNKQYKLAISSYSQNKIALID